MIAVLPAEFHIILDILKKHVPGCQVLVFGSRYKHTHYDASDLDIAIKGQERLPFLKTADIKEDFMESDLPFRVDVVDYHAISDSFRAIIDTGHFKIQIEEG